MGCAPSKSTVVSSEDNMFCDWDTCPTFVQSPPSFVSTLEKPQWNDGSGSGGHTFSNSERLLHIHTSLFYLYCIYNLVNLLTSFFFLFFFFNNWDSSILVRWLSVWPAHSGSRSSGGPDGSRCLSGSAWHEFESLTRSLEVWLDTKLASYELQKLLILRLCSLKFRRWFVNSIHAAQEVHKLHKYAGFWI